MPFGPSDVLWIGLVPAIAAAAIMFVASRLNWRTTAAWSLSVAGALVVGMLAQNARVGGGVVEKLLHPRAAIDWLPWLVLVAAGLDLLAEYIPRAWQEVMTLFGLPITALSGLFCIVAPLRLLASNALAMSRWSTGAKLGALACWTMLFAALWLTFASGRRNGQPLARGVLLVVVALGMALAVAAAGSFVQAELAGFAAAALAGTLGTAYLLGTLADGPASAAGPLAVFLGSLILLGRYHAGLSSTDVTLLFVSCAAAAGSLPSRWPVGLWPRIALRAALALVPLAIVVVSAVAAVLADPYR